MLSQIQIYELPVLPSTCGGFIVLFIDHFFVSAPSHSKLDSFFAETVHISFRAGGGGLHHFGVSKMVWLRRLCLSRVFFPPKCLTDFCKMFTNMETGR